MSFDPYLEWFRIRPSKRSGDGPPDHYVLLGIRRSESDLIRIHEAALRRMQLLRRRQTGSRADLTQRLMNEVSQARLCLTDPARKAQYDFDLEQRRPTIEPTPPASNAESSNWLLALAFVLVIGGGAATYFAVMKPPENAEPIVAAFVEEPKTPTPESVTPSQTPSAPKAADKKVKKPSNEILVAPKSKEDAIESRPALIKLRDLDSEGGAEKESTGEVVHLASVGTDGDEEDPTFLDREGRWLGFQRKAEGKSQFIVAERRASDAPFTVEYLVQGFGDGVRLQGFALEPGELSCIYATMAGQGLLQAKRPNKTTAWSPSRPLLSDEGPVKGAWPSLTADGRELYFVQQRSGKQRVLLLKRPSTDAAFSNQTEIAAFGNAFSQVAVSPDGKTMALRGTEQIYSSHRKEEGVWSPAEPILSLRAQAGPNRALVVSPCFSPDGERLYFASNRDDGAGGFDLWSAPTAMLTGDVPDLSKLAEHAPKKTAATGKRERPADKTKAADVSKKSSKKPAASPVAASDTPVTKSISEWLVLGPYPHASSETVKNVSDLSVGFEGVELLRRMPKENQKGNAGMLWSRANQFEARGVYSVALSIRLKANVEVRLVVESAPGGGVMWLDGEYGELSWRPGEPWSPLNGARQGEPIKLIAGRHRIVGIVCVGDRAKPLVARIVSAEDGSAIEGLSVSF